MTGAPNKVRGSALPLASVRVRSEAIKGRQEIPRSLLTLYLGSSPDPLEPVSITKNKETQLGALAKIA